MPGRLLLQNIRKSGKIGAASLPISKRTSQDDFVIASVALSNRTGFNGIKASLPYYLDKYGLNSFILQGNNIKPHNIEELGNSNIPLWVVGSLWADPSSIIDDTIELVKLDPTLFVVSETNQEGSTLDSLIYLYEEFIPLAASPSPICYMKRDLSTLYLVAEEYSKAEDALVEGKQLCPELNPWPAVAIYEGLLLELSTAAGDDEVFEIARQILIYDDKNITALDTLSAFGLLDLFEQGEVEIMAGDSPEQWN